jgi:cyclopropane fatty-acyl-phospholipid synthase-like methyltransferase
MDDMYTGSTYAEKNPTWHEEDAEWKANHIRDIILKNGAAHETICEVGCGTGDILLHLERHFPAATLNGFEISPHAFNRARSKPSQRVTFELADITQRQDLHFDILLAIDVFEHVEDYLTFLRRLKPLARYKIFHIPLDLSVQSVLRSSPILRMRRDVGHLHYFYKDTALATLTDCGYAVRDWKYTASRLELPNQAVSSQLMRLPRKAAFAINPDAAVRVLGGYSLMVLAE